jgi:hypothetical protein
MVVDKGQHAKGTIVEFVNREVAGKVGQGPGQIIGLPPFTRPFPPCLHPVLDGGKGDKHAMVTPEMPTRGAVRQAIFHHHPHRQRHDTVGIMTARGSHIGQVSVEVLVTRRTIVLRIKDVQFMRSS